MDKGGNKNDEGKLRMDLIPGYPLMRLAEVYTIGAKKYSDDNWRKGISYKRIFAAMLRHAWKWFMGETFDPDGQHHLSSVVWGAFALMEYEITHPEFDDRPKGIANHNDLTKEKVPSQLEGTSHSNLYISTWHGFPSTYYKKWDDRECSGSSDATGFNDQDATPYSSL